MPDNRPRILLMGLRRGGKSSIRQVVFHNMQPLETLYLESTAKPTSERLDSLVGFDLQEIPGQLDIWDSSIDHGSIFREANSIVYVIDSQDEYLLALQNVVQVIEEAYKVNPKIHFEVLIHKVDGLNEDFRQDTQRDIIQRINDDLVDVGTYDADLTFHMTSIFDQSIIEAFSRIVQKLVPEFSTLTQLLDLFCLRSGVEKAFLFDAVSKIYLATDSSPVDVETYQVCSDFVDVALDLGSLYSESMGSQGLTPIHTSQSSLSSRSPEKERILCTSRFQNGTVIYLAQMLQGLLLVGMSTAESSQKMTLIEYNVQILREGLEKIYG